MLLEDVVMGQFYCFQKVEIGGKDKLIFCGETRDMIKRRHNANYGVICALLDCNESLQTAACPICNIINAGFDKQLADHKRTHKNIMTEYQYNNRFVKTTFPFMMRNNW